MKTPQGKPREMPDADTHKAVIVEAFDFGTQKPSNPQWEKSRRCSLGFEIIGASKEDGSPFVERKEYGYVNAKKAKLAQLIIALGGDADDLLSILGKGCMITIEHKESATGSTYANITNIVPLPKSEKAGKHRTPLKSFFLDEDDDFDAEGFKEIPQFLQKKIAESDEYPGIFAAYEKKTKGGGAKAAAKPGKKK